MTDIAYKLMKRIIERGGYDAEDVMGKLDAFLAGDRISTEQYNELTGMMGRDA